MKRVVIDSQWYYAQEWAKIKSEIMDTLGGPYISDTTVIVDELGVDITLLIHSTLRYELERSNRKESFDSGVDSRNDTADN